MVPNHAYNQAEEFHPGSEAKGKLVSVLVILKCYVYPSTSFSCIFSHFRLSTPLRSNPHGPPPLLAACTSSPYPWHTLTWMVIVCSSPPMRQTCRIRGISGGVDSPTPGPILCPACGGNRSGPRGRSDWRPVLGSPLRGTSLLVPTEGKISDVSGDPPGGGPYQAPLYHPVLNLVVGIHKPRR